MAIDVSRSPLAQTMAFLSNAGTLGRARLLSSRLIGPAGSVRPNPIFLASEERVFVYSPGTPWDRMEVGPTSLGISPP